MLKLLFRFVGRFMNLERCKFQVKKVSQIYVHIFPNKNMRELICARDPV